MSSVPRPLRLRAARTGDFGKLRELWQELSGEAAQAPYGPSSFDEYWSSPKALLDHNFVVVADVGDELLGCAIAALTRHDVGHVFGLYVRPEARRQGIGRALLQSVAAVLRERGVAHVVLDVDLGNDQAAAFYERLGFTETGRRYTTSVDTLL
jgi:ribosomal protein S18 acetylase RimI-like enzyme